VQNLATAASSVVKAFAGANAAGHRDPDHFTGGNTATINIDTTNNTLSAIAAAINGAADNPGVTASILTTTDGARLVTIRDRTGAASGVTVTQSGGDGGLSNLVYDPANPTTSKLTQTQQAKDATSRSTASPRPAPATR
jgi:flagellar hook-associated protein 2